MHSEADFLHISEAAFLYIAGYSIAKRPKDFLVISGEKSSRLALGAGQGNLTCKAQLGIC
jgi:hypothetical protein